MRYQCYERNFWIVFRSYLLIPVIMCPDYIGSLYLELYRHLPQYMLKFVNLHCLACNFIKSFPCNLVEILSLYVFRHPLCMTIGVIIFLGEGAIVYRNKYLVETFGPLMQYTNKAKVNISYKFLQNFITYYIVLYISFLFYSTHF